MLQLQTTTQFRKDYKRIKRRGYDIHLLENIIKALLVQEPLAEKYCDHPLFGNYSGFRECHILPDWLLVYAISHDELLLTASRTGTHSDLFKK